MSVRVCLLLQDVTLDGGVERVVVNMANSFYRCGYDCVVISMFKKNAKIKYNLDANIPVFYLNETDSFESWMNKCFFSFSSLLSRFYLAKVITPKIYKILANSSPKQDKTVILCNSYLYTPLYKKKNIALVGVDHSRFPFEQSPRSLRFKLSTLMLRNFDMVTTLNTAEIEKWKLLGRPVKVIPNFVNEKNGPYSNEDKLREKVVLSMGRMNTPQKGFDRLIEAYALVAPKHPDWQLHIFGSGTLQGTYKKMIKDLHMEEYVKIFDFTNNPEKEYCKASIYAMCSRAEGFPMVLLEAGSYGLPIIAYDIEFGPSSIIKNEKTGFIVPDANKELFAKCLDKMMCEEQLRKNMSMCVIRDIESRYSREYIMREWLSILDMLEKIK